jgi:cytoskeletal protein CcmA (bactofilin family)
MALFAKDGNEKSEARQPSAAADNALSIIAVGMTITGDVESSGVVKVEGRIEGSIRRARQVLVGRQGSVKGDIEAREAVIGGHVEGTVTGQERVEIQSTASVQGDVHTKTIIVQEGGRINGNVRMHDAAAPVAAPAAAAAPPPRAPQPTPRAQAKVTVR